MDVRKWNSAFFAIMSLFGVMGFAHAAFTTTSTASSMPTVQLSNTLHPDTVIVVVASDGLYISRGADVRFTRIPIANVGRPYGVDVDVLTETIYWTDTSGNSIKRALFDGTEYAIVTTDNSGVRGIALVPQEEEIYWTNVNSGAIHRVRYDGSGKETIVVRNRYDYRYTNPSTTLAIDTIQRELYWGGGQYVHRASCDDGDSVTRRLYTTHNDMYGLTYTESGSTLYTCRGAEIRSFRSSSSSDSATIRLPIGSDCRGLAYSGGNIFWTDDYRDEVVVTFSDGTTRVLGTGLRQPRDVFAGRTAPTDPNKGKCNFENRACEWRWTAEQNTDFEWIRRRGRVQMDNSSGPLVDHTTQTHDGYYMFLGMDDLVSSDIRPGDIAAIRSPLVNTSGEETKCFRFWYHMHDMHNGTLTVFFQPDSEVETAPGRSDTPAPESRAPRRLLWTQFGAQPDGWIGVDVPVKGSGVGHLLIQAMVGDPTLNSVAIDDLQFGVCTQASSVRCDDTAMTIFLDRAQLGIATHDDVTLRSASCRGYQYDRDTTAITTSYNDCGTTVYESDDVIVFSNEVTVLPRSEIRKSALRISVNCTMARSKRVEMSYLAHSWIKYIREEGYGSFSVGIHRYDGNKFFNAYPSSTYPHQVEVGDTIYMATETAMAKDTVTSRNSRCWATQSPDPMDSMAVELVDDGCPVEGSSVQVFSSKTPGVQPFSFEAFSFGSNLELIYVHCDVKVCRQLVGSSCNRNCSESRRSKKSRKRRETDSGPHRVSQGPFMLRRSAPRKEGDNQASSRLFPIVVCLTVLVAASMVIIGGLTVLIRLKKGATM